MFRNVGRMDPFVERVPFLDWRAAKVTDAIARRASSAFRRWERRRTIRALEGLNDWVLKDMGISRGEIPRFVDSINGDNPQPASPAKPDEVSEKAETQAG